MTVSRLIRCRRRCRRSSIRFSLSPQPGDDVSSALMGSTSNELRHPSLGFLIDELFVSEGEEVQM